MRATGYLLSSLAAEGADHIFLVPGGLTEPLFSDLTTTPGLLPLVAAHEAGAVAMADGYARASGRFGVCLASGSPGVGNMITSVATARADASPVLCLTVPASAATDGDVAPDPCNAVSLLAPVTAASFIVEDSRLLPRDVRACLTRMLAGPQAPVHLRLPLAVQRAAVSDAWTPLDASLSQPRFVDGGAVERLWRILVPEGGGAAPMRVAILAGAGVEKSGATEALTAFAEQFEIPVATTLRAKGVFPEDHRLSLGVFGPAGHRPAVETLLSGQVEVLIVLGSGLSRRDTFGWDTRLLPSHTLAHVDVDPAVIGRTFRTHVPIVGDCRAALARMIEGGSARIMRFRAGNELRSAWVGGIKASGPACFAPEQTESAATPLHPARVAAALRQVLPRDGAVVVDSGSHRAFFAHYFPAYGPRTYFAAVGHAPMGWAIGAAIGVKTVLGDRPVACVTGDGCMLMQGMEVATAARYGAAVLYVVLNNQALGALWPQAAGRGAHREALAALPPHDFAAFARSMGARGLTVTTPEELVPALTEGLAGPGPCVVDVRCGREYALPELPSGPGQAEQGAMI